MDKKEYLALVEKQKLKKKPILLKMPSGATWKVLPFNIKQYSVSGKLPLHLFAELGSIKDLNAEEFESQINGKDILNMLEIARDAMLNNVIEPQITIEETEHSITPQMLDPEDFDYFTQWALRGGQAQNSFRTQSSPKTTKKRKRTRKPKNNK